MGCAQSRHSSLSPSADACARAGDGASSNEESAVDHLELELRSVNTVAGMTAFADARALDMQRQAAAIGTSAGASVASESCRKALLLIAQGVALAGRMECPAGAVDSLASSLTNSRGQHERGVRQLREWHETFAVALDTVQCWAQLLASEWRTAMSCSVQLEVAAAGVVVLRDCVQKGFWMEDLDAGLSALRGLLTPYPGPLFEERHWDAALLAGVSGLASTVRDDEGLAVCSSVTRRRGLVRHRNGDIYVGQLNGFLAHGDGILWSDEDGVPYVYRGQFDNDIPHGRGEQILADGSRYNGELRYGNKCGDAVFESANGTTYSGQFVNNAFHGQGSYSVHRGGKYEGGWEGGQYHGHGKFTWPGGEVYEGSYVRGVKHGRGEFRWPDGKVFVGDWVHGEREEPAPGGQQGLSSSEEELPLLSSSDGGNSWEAAEGDSKRAVFLMG
mmetsp:Transcript_13304/g.33264  ORF Transcript_13304/g.33264 Transcript_13304/m.33264 type:complete len:445 (+) Transcript_13304:1-1335(+)